MKSRSISPQHHGWVESILDKEHIDFLWERIEEVERGDGKDVKGK